jgi:hypothetical protein
MYNKLGYSRGVIANLSDAPSLPNPQTGETVFCTENYRVLTYDGALWMCDDFVRLVNGSGATRAAGDLLIASTVAYGNVVVTTTTQSPRVIGPVVYSSTNGSPIAIAIKGKYKCKVDFYPTVSPITTIGGKAYTYSSGNLGAAIDSVSTPLVGGFFGWVLEPLPAPLVQTNRKMLIRGKVEFW